MPKSETIDISGIRNARYLTKKGTPSGEDARLNRLPPGQSIEDQYVADISEQPYKELKMRDGMLKYAGDGGK